MNELSKISAEHLRRCAIVYVRQSSTTQVEHNRESTARQYELAERAARRGWRRDQVKVIDEDLGISGSGLSERTGFARMTAEVGLGQVGIVLGLEVSRLARNNADWYRLLDLCGVTHTLIGDGDGIYHPGLFNDRLVLGLKGTMSEAELHVLRARLLGGIRNKAARGELHRGLPVGLVRGDADGEVLLHPDESVQAAIHAVFDRFAEFGSARRVWLWFRSQGLRFPLHSNSLVDLRWVAPTYTKIHQVLTNPFYAGVYVYGRTQQTCYLDAGGRIRKRIRQRDREQWPVFIRDHHAGYIDWNTFEANQKPGAEDSSSTAPEWRRRERRRRAPARPRRMWTLRSAPGRTLQRPVLGAWISLRRQEHRQRPGRVLPQHRRCADRCGCHRSVPCGSRARRPGGLAPGDRAVRSRSRDDPRAVPSRRRACALQRAARRATLSRRRPGEQTRRTWT